MRVLHVGPFKIDSINGSYAALWNLAQGQAQLGDDVSILRLGKPVSQDQGERASKDGISLYGFPSPMWRNYWRDTSGLFRAVVEHVRPDIVHLQYVRIPKYLFVSRYLTRYGIPFVVSPHGGLNSTEMQRRPLRKKAYWFAIERRVHALAKGLHFVSPPERDDYLAHYDITPRETAVIPNAVAIPKEKIGSWTTQPISTLRFAYFGRYDVWTKGLDLACEMVRKLGRDMPAELHLFGGSGRKHHNEMEDLRQSFPDVTIVDHGMVIGDEKFEAMTSFDAYIQFSRHEVFGMSLVEAMGVGVPVFVSERCDLARDLEQAGAAIVLPFDPVCAAEKLAQSVGDQELLRAISAAGVNWVATKCEPRRVAESMRMFYERAAA
jgi:glycosyltransferase involved in cell wall biosynthesis